MDDSLDVLQRTVQEAAEAVVRAPAVDLDTLDLESVTRPYPVVEPAPTCPPPTVIVNPPAAPRCAWIFSVNRGEDGLIATILAEPVEPSST